MIISNQDGVIRVEISVLVVEDEVEQAISLARLVESYNSIFENKQSINKSNFEVKYRVLINGKSNFKPTDTFEGDYAYLDSLNYLNENFEQVDLILCDHYLRTQNGNGILTRAYELETIYSRRCYKVLHSIEPEYQKFQNEKHVNFVWDAKTQKAIHTVTLPRFEEKVLKPIFYGNPALYHLTYNNFEENDVSLKNDYKIQDIPLINVLYMYRSSQNRSHYYHYLNDLFKVDMGYFTEYSLTHFKKEGHFIRVSDALYINKLWYADHDVHLNKVKFISRDIIVLDIESLSLQRSKKKAGHEISLLRYFSGLAKKKEYPEFPEFNLDTYFHL